MAKYTISRKYSRTVIPTVQTEKITFPKKPNKVISWVKKLLK